jgi:ATP dependent DNA ligase domain
MFRDIWYFVAPAMSAAIILGWLIFVLVEPWEAASVGVLFLSPRKNREKQFVIDGEAVILGVDGISDFNALHSGKHNHEVQLYAFDVLAMEGDDLRPLPLSMRKASLAKLLHRRPSGIFLGGFEQGEIGPDLFPPRLSDDSSRQQQASDEPRDVRHVLRQRRQCVLSCAGG